MATKLPAIVLVKVNGEYVRSIAGKMVLTDSEPCTVDVTLSNWDGAYGPDSDLAQVHETEPLVLVVLVVERLAGGALGVWTSPDFIVEEYEVGGLEVQLSGRCRLSLLDLDDTMVIWDEETGSSTVEGDALSTILAAIGAEAGLSVSGAASRTVRDYNLCGNLLQLFTDLIYPLQRFKMGGTGAKTTIQCLSSPSGTFSYTDKDHLLDCRFRRSRYVRNRAVVERLESGGGDIVLASDDREALTGLAGTSDLIELSEPSRSFWIEWECARGDMYWSAYDENGDPLNPPGAPLSNGRYAGVTLATHVRFSYVLGIHAENGDTFNQRYRYTVWGAPAGAEPPVAGYSKLGEAGSRPARRFPEPFSLPSIDTASDAQAAADAIADEGNSEGSSFRLDLGLTYLVPSSYSTVSVSDSRAGLSVTGVARVIELDWDERRGGKNGITVEATVSE